MKSAGILRPVALRSLDAPHLAPATSLGDDLGLALRYDVRLLETAMELRLDVRAAA